jgi:hypothetical protein
MPQYMDTRENRLVRLDVPAAESSIVKAALPPAPRPDRRESGLPEAIHCGKGTQPPPPQIGHQDPSIGTTGGHHGRGEVAPTSPPLPPWLFEGQESPGTSGHVAEAAGVSSCPAAGRLTR